MYAVIATGGKQYKVAENDIIEVEKLAGEAGQTVTLDQVLLLGAGSDVKVGAPTVAGAAVTAEIVKQKKCDTVIVFKKKRRQNYRRKNGHRQPVTVLKILSLGAAKKAAPKKKAEVAEAAEA